MKDNTLAAAQPRSGLGKWARSMRGQQMICTILFMLIPLLLLFTFTYLPFFKMVEFSFFKMKYIGKRTFVGLKNYIDVFTRDDCFGALKLSLYYMVGSVVQMAVALLFATILSFKVKGSKFFRGALYFPFSSLITCPSAWTKVPLSTGAAISASSLRFCCRC